MTTEAIFAEALALPADKRAILIAQLCTSLNPETMPTNELPTGVPIYGRGKGKMKIDVDDDRHLADFEEYMQ